MPMFRSLVFCALLAAPAALLAQGNPVSNAVREVARESGQNLLAAAEAMPPDKYGFKPTPAQMTFGELILHIQGDNRTTCSAIGGHQPDDEAKLAPTDAKDKLVPAFQRSLAFCEAALAQVNDAQLGDVVSYYGHDAARVVALIGLVTDWADHYGQQAIYLRLNGVLPPTAH
jgi:uncharacterized damage-inducible protein DinB